MNTPLEGVAPLTHLGLIRAQGEDAAKFLQGQLSNDFVLLDQTQARLAAYCNPKGRMLASFIGFKRDPNDILLICSRDLLAGTLKRLSMFVLRAKVKLSDASAEFCIAGVCGQALRQLSAGLPAALDQPWSRGDLPDQHLIMLYPADGVARALWLAPASTALPAGAALNPERWAWGEVRSGIATVTQALSEALVPQMLNYESVGGVNFKKGCYPGQEVVARSQFRGTLKRRAYLAHADRALQAGQEVFVPSDPSQPCGLVVQAAPAPAGGWDAIVSLQISAFDAGVVHAGSADAAALQLSPPPYPLLADI